MPRGVTPGATLVTKVAPKFSDALTLLQPGGGQILPMSNIANVAPKISPWLHL